MTWEGPNHILQPPLTAALMERPPSCGAPNLPPPRCTREPRGAIRLQYDVQEDGQHLDGSTPATPGNRSPDPRQ